MTSLQALIAASAAKLLDSLAETVEELSSVIDQIGFLRVQELQIMQQAWNGVLEDSIQKRDRAAKYAAVSYTCELYTATAQRDALIERKFFILKLIDHLEHRDNGVV